MKSRIAQNVIVVFALAIPTLIFAALVYQRTSPVAEELHAQISTLTASLGEADARLNAVVSKMLLRDEEGAASRGQVLREAGQRQLAKIDRLGVLFSQAGLSDSDLQSRFDAYREALKTKTQLTENFIGQIAGFDEAYRRAYAGINGLLADDQVDAGLRSRLSGVLTAMLDFTGGGARETKTPLAEALTGLETWHEDRPENVPRTAPLGDVIGRLKTILKEKPELDATVEQIAKVPTARLGDEIRDAYALAHRAVLERDANHRRMLLAYFALLIVGAIYITLRWRNQHQLQTLQSDNTMLEQHVAARTKELTQAYQELQQSQSRLVQSEKMSALGQMVAGVAHEINTPLAYTRSNVELVKEMLEDVSSAQASADENGLLDDIRELLDASASGLDQISEMVMSLKDFSRVDRKPIEKFDLNKGLDSALLIANNKLKHKVEVIKHYGDIPPVTCNPSQINQVFLNMLVNAAQAIEERGSITLTTVASGDHVDVIIEDDGKGIPEETLPNIFDPFFTTKGIGEGTGLGLSICYQIIEQHGGNISVDSQPGKGTRFTISLFISEDEAILPSAQQSFAAA